MARWTPWVVGAMVTVLGTACEYGHSCTAIGCGSGVEATLSAESGTWQDGQYALALTLDGRHAECSFRLPDDLSAGEGRSMSCGAGTRLELATNGDARVFVDVGPKELTLELTRDGSEVLSATPLLNYRESHPNGPDCGVCRSAHVGLTVAD